MLGRRGPCQPPRRGSLAALALAALCLWAACALGPAGATEAARCEVLLDGRMESIALIRISLRTFNHKPVLSLSWNGVLGVGTDAGKKLFFIIKVPGKTGYMFQVLCCYIVCQDFLERFYSSLKEKHSDFSMASIENELVRSCMNTKGKENRLCYYIGATSDAATKIMSEVSRPMSAHVPVPKICEKLKKIDVQICELKYERKLDLTSVDLSKMRVSELRKILDSWGEVCRACIEKTDFVDLIKELAPKHTAATSRADL